MSRCAKKMLFKNVSDAYLLFSATGRESPDVAERITIALHQFCNEKDKAEIVMIEATIH